MDFWQTFWATMWGALGGAVVAAFTAWLFSLDLRRREREDRQQEREQERLDRVAERDQDREIIEADRTERYNDGLDAQVSKVIELLYAYGNALDALPPGSRRLVQAGSPVDQARSSLFGALRGALLRSRAPDTSILSAAWTAAVNLPSGLPREGLPVDLLAGALELWRRSSTLTTLDILGRISDLPSGPFNEHRTE